MRARALDILRRLRREEGGQSLIVVTLAMVVVMGVSAMAIDVATWYQKHHQAQVVADAAALAAANCLANPGAHSGLGPSCTSGSDVSAAQQVAIDYAAHNGVTLSVSQVSIDTTKGTVSVTANTTAPAFFANLLGIHSATQTAAATAGWSAGSTPCNTTAQAAGECYAIYAANQTCGTGNGLVTNETSEQINGAVHSQGSLNISNGSFAYLGPITYSSGNCTYTAQQNATIASGGSFHTPTAGANQPAGFWPLDYSKVFSACSATGTYQCTTSAGTNGVAGSPSYCTYATTSTSGFTFGWVNNSDEIPTSGNIYCSIGSGNPSDPSTWNGPINFTNGANVGSSGDPVSATFIGGYVHASSSVLYLTPASKADNCLVYATDGDSAAGGAAIEFGNGTYNFGGTMFGPNGTVNLNSTSATAAFLEAQNVDIVNLSFAGDGPTVTATGATSSGGDSLQQ